MEEFLQQTLLYDFYGELLTEHQRKVYEEVVLNDLSYSEAAEMFGVSRQGVHELVKRCNKILSEYESKLHLVERFVQIREMVKQIQEMASQIDFIDKETLASGVRELSGKILEELYRDKYALLEKVARLEAELEAERKLNATLEKGLSELQEITLILKG